MLILIYSYNYKSFVAFSTPKSSKTYEKETFPIRFVPEYLTRIFRKCHQVAPNLKSKRIP